MAKTQEQIQAEMAANSAAWHSASATERKALEAANQALGAQIGSSFNSSTGTWTHNSGGSGSSSGSTGSTGNKTSSGGSMSNGAYSPYTFNGSATTVGTNTYDQEAIKAEMNANSKLWHTADDATKRQLEARNQELGALLGGTVAFDPVTGYWNGDAELIKQIEQTQPTFDWNEEKPTFDSQYEAQIQDMLNQILNRDKFSYDVTTDPLYQQYADMYNREGDRAMRDTLATAAAGAGGMNSYAITAAQQANDYYASQLGDKIPELYQLAYDMYLTDIDNQVRDLGLLQGMDDTQYNRYRDTMGDWRNDRDFAYGAYRDDMGDFQWNKTFDYNAGRDNVMDLRYENEWNYGLSRDEASDSLNDNANAYNKAMEFLTQGVMPDATTLAAAGISAAEASAYIAAMKEANASKGSSSKGNGYDGDKKEEKDDLGYTGDEDTPGVEPEPEYDIDFASIIALGRGGNLTAEDLAELEAAGEIERYIEGGLIKFRNVGDKRPVWYNPYPDDLKKLF